MAVKMTQEAAVQFAKLPKKIRERMRKLVDRLQKWPEVSGVKALSGDLAGWYRLRTGDYRLRFRLQKVDVIIDKIGHRSDFYEDPTTEKEERTAPRHVERQTHGGAGGNGV